MSNTAPITQADNLDAAYQAVVEAERHEVSCAVETLATWARRWCPEVTRVYISECDHLSTCIKGMEIESATCPHTDCDLQTAFRTPHNQARDEGDRIASHLLTHHRDYMTEELEVTTHPGEDVLSIQP